MVKSRCNIMVLVLTVLFFNAFYCMAQDKVLKLATDPWPPYAFGKEGGKLEHGYALEIGTALCEHLGCSLKADLFPWERVLIYMKNGAYDITFPIQRKPEREAFLIFSDVILEDRVFVWHLKGRKDALPDWQTIEDLTPFTIGIVSGYTYQAQMDEAIEKNIIKTDKVSSAEFNFKKLLGNRFDAFLESESVVMSYFQKNPGWREQITHARKIVSKDVFRIGISKKSEYAQMLEQINNAVQAMKTDGTIDRIMN